MAYAFLSIVLSLSIALADEFAPNTFVFDRKELLALKWRIAKGETLGDELHSYRCLIKSADEAMKAGPFSVMTKPTTPPSGDKHDYESLATYYWPCNNATLTPGPKCNLTTGLPWVGVDGHKNPYGDKFDKVPMDAMILNVQYLSTAYFYSGNKSYAKRAALLIRTWFLDALTFMHPNLNFSAIRPGINNGSSSGVVALHNAWIIVESVGFLNGSQAWTVDDQSRLMTWFGKMLHWLRTNPFGQEANDKPNNHGTWSDVLRSSFALYSDHLDVADEVAKRAIEKRIMAQIDQQGQMPFEDLRVNSASYTLMNTRAFFNLARLASFSGVNLFDYKTEDHRGIRLVFEFVIPFALGQQAWPFKEINEDFSWGSAMELFRRAANAYQDPAYEYMIKELPPYKIKEEEYLGSSPDIDPEFLTNMLYPRQFYSD